MYLDVWNNDKLMEAEILLQLLRKKKTLMRQIDQASFAMDDVLLYLDTHPTDQEALNYYHHAAGLRREAMEPGRHSMVLFWLTLSKIWTAGPG